MIKLTLYVIGYKKDSDNPIYCHSFILSKEKTKRKIEKVEDLGEILAKGMVDNIDSMFDGGLINIFVTSETKIESYVKAKEYKIREEDTEK